jgi:hypothetical protein
VPVIESVETSPSGHSYITSMSWRRWRLRGDGVKELHALLLAANVNFTFRFDDRMDCYTLTAALPDTLYRTIRERF